MNISRKITAFVLTLCLLCSSLTLAALNVGAEENTLLGEPVSLADDSSTESDIFGYILPQDNQKISLVPVSSDGATDVSSISWTLENGVLTISGDGDMPSYSSSSPAPWASDRYYISSVVVEEGITSISTQAFAMFYSLTSVTLPQSLKKIGEAAFYGAYCLESIEIPESMETIDIGAFAECTSLSNVNCLGAVKVGDYAFQSTLIQNFTLGKNTQISPLTFYGGALKSYSITECNPHYTVKDGVLYSADGKTLVSYPLASTADEYAISYGTEIIGESAFICNQNAKVIQIPDTVTVIKDSAFCSTVSLESITIPDSVTALGFFTFSNSSIKSVIIGSGIKVLPYRAFEECKSLESVTFKNGVEIIDRYVFLYCDALKEVTLPESTQYVYDGAFPESTEVYCLNTELDKIGTCGYNKVEKFSVPYKKLYDYAFEVLELVNIERGKEGLSPLVMNKELLEVAMLRSAEISVYYSHERPDFTSCFTASDLMMAENIAVWYDSPEAVVEGWMNSPGHRANILNESATVIGIGCANVAGGLWWAQCFGMLDDTENCEMPENTDALAPISIPYTSYENGEMVKSPYEFYIRFSQYNPSISDDISVSLHIKVLDNPGRITPIISDNLTWSSSPDEIGSINSDQTLTLNTPGALTVTAKLKHFEVSAELTVRSRGILGDANYDGTVNVKDATHVQKHVANILKIWGLDNEFLADANGDGEINVKDATVIQKYCARIDTGLNIGGKV